MKTEFVHPITKEDIARASKLTQETNRWEGWTPGTYQPDEDILARFDAQSQRIMDTLTFRPGDCARAFFWLFLYIGVPGALLILVLWALALPEV